MSTLPISGTRGRVPRVGGVGVLPGKVEALPDHLVPHAFGGEENDLRTHHEIVRKRLDEAMAHLAKCVTIRVPISRARVCVISSEDGLLRVHSRRRRASKKCVPTRSVGTRKGLDEAMAHLASVRR